VGSIRILGWAASETKGTQHRKPREGSIENEGCAALKTKGGQHRKLRVGIISSKIPITKDSVHFFLELGMDRSEVERIQYDFRNDGFGRQVYEVLTKWTEKYHRDATFCCIINALKRLDKSATFLKDIIDTEV